MAKFSSHDADGRKNFGGLSRLVKHKDFKRNLQRSSLKRKKYKIRDVICIFMCCGALLFSFTTYYKLFVTNIERPNINHIKAYQNDRESSKLVNEADSFGHFQDDRIPYLAKPKDADESLLSLSSLEKVSKQTSAKEVSLSKPADDSTIKIAFAVSITSCSEQISGLIDGAAVLKHSIHINAIEDKSKFSYKLFAFIHPEAIKCEPHIQKLGYQVLIKDTPVDPKDIKGDFYREHVVKSGCCGIKEFLKLYAYTLLDYPIVVHLDIDTLILKPLDDLFLVMLNHDGDETTNNKYGVPNLKNVPVMYDKGLPPKVDAFFTRDYNMVRPGKKYPGFQGGFLIFRPSQEAYDEYVKLILEGNFQPGSGWGGLGFGGYYGAQQIQGITSFFYDYLHTNTAVELNRCVYNSMADHPRATREEGNKCRDGRDFCEDCRGKPLEDIRAIHFTLCQKPWLCHYMSNQQELPTTLLCNKFHHEWHRIRADLEDWLEVKQGKTGGYRSEHFYKHCKYAGPDGYIPLFSNE